MHPGRFADKVGRGLHKKINAKRRKRGLEPLEGRTAMIEAATNHSRAMARKDELFHNGPDGSIQAHAPDEYNRVYENIAYVYPRRSPSAAVEKLFSQWIDSPTHERNMFRPEGRYDGLGIWLNGDKVFATHLIAQNESSSTFLAKLFG